MSEDLTKKLPVSDMDPILTAIKKLEVSLRSSIDNLVTWVGSLDSRLKRLEKTVDERLYDTRPMWHKIDSDVCQLQVHIGQMQAGQDELRSEVRDAVRQINQEFHSVDDPFHRLEIDRER